MAVRLAALAVAVVSVALTGCLEPEEEAQAIDRSAPRPPVTTVAIDPAEITVDTAAPVVGTNHLNACVAQIQFGAFAGDPNWTNMWNAGGQTEAGIRDVCVQLAMSNPAEVIRIHDEWVAFEALVAEQRAADTPGRAPSVYYHDCTAARAAGVTPVRRGDPGYAEHLDRDGDGIGCE